MNLASTVPRGPYLGQSYRIIGSSRFPRWVEVCLTDESGHEAVREVREWDLEEE